MAIDGMALDSWRPQALAVLRIVTGVIEVFLGALFLIGLLLLGVPLLRVLGRRRLERGRVAARHGCTRAAI